MFKCSSILYPERYTVQSPILETDLYGNTTIRYEPLELISYSVTFPTGPWTYFIIEGAKGPCSTKEE